LLVAPLAVVAGRAAAAQLPRAGEPNPVISVMNNLGKIFSKKVFLLDNVLLLLKINL